MKYIVKQVEGGYRPAQSEMLGYIDEEGRFVVCAWYYSKKRASAEERRLVPKGHAVVTGPSGKSWTRLTAWDFKHGLQERPFNANEFMAAPNPDACINMIVDLKDRCKRTKQPTVAKFVADADQLDLF